MSFSSVYKKTEPCGVVCAYFDRKRLRQKKEPELAQKCRDLVSAGCACGGVVCVIRDPLLALCERCDHKRKAAPDETTAKRQRVKPGFKERMLQYIEDLEPSPVKAYASRVVDEGNWQLGPGLLLEWDHHGYFYVQDEDVLFDLWKKYIVKIAG